MPINQKLKILILLSTLSFLRGPLHAESGILLDDEFEKDENKWSTYTSNGTASIQNGKYLLEDAVEKRHLLVGRPINIDTDRDFKIEAVMTKIDGLENNGYGIAWGIQNSNNFFYYQISGNGHYRCYKQVNGSYYKIVNWGKNKHINRGNSTNKLAIQKSGDKLNLYVNGKKIKSIPFKPFFGYNVGLILSTKMNIAVDRFTVQGAPYTANTDDKVRAIYLGNNSYVRLPRFIFDYLKDATIETWIKWEELDKGYSTILNLGWTGHNIIVKSRKSKKGKNKATLVFLIDENGDTQHTLEADCEITPKTWYHIAFICGEGGMAFYLNGQLVAKNEYTGGLDRSARGWNLIGRWKEGFHGDIAELRVWNKRRSQDEIVSTMDRQLTGEEASLIGYWRFDRARNQSVPDDSPAGNAALLCNEAAIITLPAPVGGFARNR